MAEDRAESMMLRWCVTVFLVVEDGFGRRKNEERSRYFGGSRAGGSVSGCECKIGDRGYRSLGLR